MTLCDRKEVPWSKPFLWLVVSILISNKFSRKRIQGHCVPKSYAKSRDFETVNHPSDLTQWLMLSYSTGITRRSKQNQNQVHGDVPKLLMHLWGRHSSWVKKTADLSSYSPDSVTDIVLQIGRVWAKGRNSAWGRQISLRGTPLPFYTPWDAERQSSGFLSFQVRLAANDQKLKLSMHFKSTTLIVEGFPLLPRWLCCDAPSWWSKILWWHKPELTFY